MKKTKGIAVALALSLVLPLAAQAGGKTAIDETKWISLGIGGRAAYSAVDDAGTT